MLWSLLKIAVFVVVAAALAWGASLLLDTPGGVTISFGGREFAVTPLGFVVWLIVLVIAAVILLNVVGLIVAVIRFIFGDETALSRFFSRGRQQRGVDALSSSMLALASGEPDLAMRKAQKAERLLGRREMTALVKAQAAEMAGDRKKALDSYSSLLSDDHTRFAGMNGAMRLKLDEGQNEVALALAKKAFALRPDNKPLLGTLFELQSSAGDWAGARETLNALMHARHMPRDVGVRRDAILSLADARKAIAEGDVARGHAAAKQANKLAPTLVPAAALASEAYAAEGAKRKATKALTRAWAEDQHPDIAVAFAALEPNETPSARRRRFETLVAAAPASAESRLLAAELAIADEDFPGARKALGDLAQSEPTTRSLAVMAAIERGQGAPDAVVRGWLAKAVSAPRGPQWTCAKCHHVHAAWTPVCGECGAFDTLDWRSPAHSEGVEASMLPLIVGADAPHPDPEPQAQPA
ncbi:heme biosynthesis HemY N-terminal domain-containing protein [Amaricoccus sp.]|uniref:heme biosynthesis protein HemY n=1 Tax=Amaricoccus sp. TaxID=1872485 RepID=UPI001B4E8F43|nr:heme biosynthesis HemY N-terminal domain-containing protein [Amaricoccus sp.]MBP7001455.1 tetratricopeptide repeat protein [Amaricoccus sp.]